MPLPQSAELFFGLRLTEEQKIYANSIYDNLFTGVQARAGSGKTTIALGVAKILGKPTHYIFPTVQEKALGYTTGDERQKESKYLAPLYDGLVKIGEQPIKAIYNELTAKTGTGWVHPHSVHFERGRNYEDCTIIIDEAQNLTKNELKTILTRVHDNCHVVLMGDMNQCDIDPKKSGFHAYLYHYSTEPYFQMCYLTKNFRGAISSHAETLPA
jgi:phosphate starvation-inducible PhoH-like protein